MTLTITVDRINDTARAAVWKNGELHDLYLDSLTKPSLDEAVVIARLIRQSPPRKKNGTRSAWFDASLDTNLYVDALPTQAESDPKEGDLYVLKIQSTQEGDKAPTAKILYRVNDAAPLRGEKIPSTCGIFDPPPTPWQRAMNDIGTQNLKSIIFQNESDYAMAKSITLTQTKNWPISYNPRENPHPQLDDLIDELTSRTTDLGGGCNLIIEKTQAFWTIDINASESANPLTINMTAMRAIARRMRLTNMGGIILIDALRMPNRPDSSKMLNVLKRATETDPAKINIYGQTKLGIVELTRQRRGLSLYDMIKQ